MMRAYRRPREFTWVSGILLIGAVHGLRIQRLLYFRGIS